MFVSIITIPFHTLKEESQVFKVKSYRICGEYFDTQYVNTVTHMYTFTMFPPRTAPNLLLLKK
jgi:hypothetical protein